MSSIASDWRSFRRDTPGKRFKNHHKRMREGSRAGAIARVTLGVLLAIGGIVLLFIPGPGLLVVLFGLGLLGGESKWLAGVLDLVEPPVRRVARRAKRWWKARAKPVKAVLVVFAAAGVAAAGYGAYRWWTN